MIIPKLFDERKLHQFALSSSFVFDYQTIAESARLTNQSLGAELFFRIIETYSHLTKEKAEEENQRVRSLLEGLKEKI
ncbi:hypothetical protein ACVRXQ_06730 [Streptococcus panodentis]|uniref:Uncharacterized protein n=1 Tax=Streptococcus panodentis TaxID=1581472 RepID=A0ABS5B099_9STRE|nr:hypothetical protein [Streptococcus panodentis]MBP2622257.1 hypothetical protein [Streptococcus panodentis]